VALQGGCFSFKYEAVAINVYLYRYIWAGFLLFIWSISLSASVNKHTLAILVNKNDPESIEIAEYYQQLRQIPAGNIIYLDFKAGVDALPVSEFKNITAQLSAMVPGDIQAYALAWRKPWKVGCMSITSAFSLGFNADYCAEACKTTRPVKYYNSQSKQPFTDYGIRPSMLLSANDIAGVKRLIERGESADYSRPLGTAYLLSTSDKQRNVRSRYYPLVTNALGSILNIEILKVDAIKNKNSVMFYFTGSQKVRGINDNIYLPGAVADHLTSFGGRLFGSGQMSVLDWIDAGVTGTYGTVVEPCNFVHKFPDPAIVMKKYLSGSTLIEAYWKSVRMPGQGLFVGEPLAAPYKGCKVIIGQHGKPIYMDIAAENYVERVSRSCN